MTMPSQKNLPDKTPTQNLYLAIFGELPEHDMELADLPELSDILSSTLTPRYAAVIKRCFGIECAKENHAKIGMDFGVGANAIGTIKKNALQRLKHSSRISRIQNLFLPRTELRTQTYDLNVNPDAYSIAIEELDLSVRAFSCLKRASINTVSDITALSNDELLRVRNLGRKSADEVKAKVNLLGLSLRDDYES